MALVHRACACLLPSFRSYASCLSRTDGRAKLTCEFATSAFLLRRSTCVFMLVSFLPTDLYFPTRFRRPVRDISVVWSQILLGKSDSNISPACPIILHGVIKSEIWPPRFLTSVTSKALCMVLKCNHIYTENQEHASGTQRIVLSIARKFRSFLP